MTSRVVRIDLGEPANSCFVMMPFAGSYQIMYERVIVPAITEAGLTAIRADEVYTTPQIMREIWKQIRAARVVLAELTGKNPNVLYELGLAHALGKPSIIITRDEADVPFDLRALRYRYYDTGHPFWGEDLRQALSSMLGSLLGQKQPETVLEAVIVPDVAETAPAPADQRSAQESPVHRIAGLWHGTAKFRTDASIYRWRLQLSQFDRNLSGTATITYDDEGVECIVEQSMAGQIEGVNVSLVGTSYSFIKQGPGRSWTLESFACVLEDDDRTLNGKIKADLSGKITLKRMSVTP